MTLPAICGSRTRVISQGRHQSKWHSPPLPGGICRSLLRTRFEEGRCQRMSAVAFQRGGDGQRAAPVEVAEGVDRDDARMAVAERAGLVEDDPVGAREGVQGFAAQREHAQLRQRAVRGGQCGGHGQRQRAGAADHQHRQRDLEGARRFVHAPPQVDAQGDQRQRRDEDVGDAVGGAGDRGPLFLRAFDQSHQLREAGVGAGLGHAQARGPLAAEAAGEGRVACPFRHRQRFAGEQGLVEGRAASVPSP